MPPPDPAALRSAVRDHPDGTTVVLRVVPRAPRTVLAGRYGDALKLKVHAPPVDGAANLEVCRYLAGACGVRVQDVALIRGERSRDKVVLIRGGQPAAVRDALRQA